MARGAPAPVVIGLDVGTTGVKAVAFAPGTPWRHAAIREYPLLQPAPGQLVQDPATILAACTGALAQTVAAVGEAEVVAVSVSAAMHGLIALDAECVPITPLITWADFRAAGEAWALHRSGQAAALHAATGVPVHPMTPLVKLLWFAEHDRQTWTAARWWVGLKDYLLWWLTGTLTTELSSASGTGLLDMSTRTWSTVALGLCGLPAGRLPDILATTATLALSAATASQVGLPTGTPVVVGAADGPLGNLGTGAIGRESPACRSGPAARCASRWTSRRSTAPGRSSATPSRSRRGSSAWPRATAAACSGGPAARWRPTSWPPRGTRAPTPP